MSICCCAKRSRRHSGSPLVLTRARPGTLREFHN
jgi:hypothetical protein